MNIKIDNIDLKFKKTGISIDTFFENKPLSARLKMCSSKEEIQEVENYNIFTIDQPNYFDFKLNDSNTLRNFLTKPLEKGIWLNCKLDRKVCEKKIIKFYLTIYNSDKLVLCSIKRPKKSYKIYMNSQDSDSNYLGKLKSNFFGTEFNTYDSGDKPKKDKNKVLHRSNIAAITYVQISY